MLAYKESIRTQQDILELNDLLKKLNMRADVIVIPFENDDIKIMQTDSMLKTWDNEADKAWDEL